MTWLLMIWRQNKQGHRQPYYWYRSSGIFRPQHRVNLAILCLLHTKNNYVDPEYFPNVSIFKAYTCFDLIFSVTRHTVLDIDDGLVKWNGNISSVAFISKVPWNNHNDFITWLLQYFHFIFQNTDVSRLLIPSFDEYLLSALNVLDSSQQT